MPSTITTEYQVANAIGRVVQTFDGAKSKERAVKFAKSEMGRLGDLTVEEVTVTVSRRRVYRPRPASNQAIMKERAGCLA